MPFQNQFTCMGNSVYLYGLRPGFIAKCSVACELFVMQSRQKYEPCDVDVRVFEHTYLCVCVCVCVYAGVSTMEYVNTLVSSFLATVNLCMRKYHQQI